MHAGRQYGIKEFLLWTRRDTFWVVLWAIIPTILYDTLNWKWLVIPWLPIALVGTAAAFIIGFKNNATYDRLWEARQIWGAIVNLSRTWGIMVRDFVTDKHVLQAISKEELRSIHKKMIYRHIAWLTALRFQLRQKREWENMDKSYNAEYRNKWFKVQELQLDLGDELKKFLSDEERSYILSKSNRATHLISLQSIQLKEILERGLIDDFKNMQLQNLLKDFYDQQGKCERIKNFPYPRQFASINLFFIRLFIILVPLGMLQEFAKMGENWVWLNIPFSALVSWVFNSMEKVGESTENPFEGNANDVPITALSRTIEIDLKEMLDETDIPESLQPVNKILM
jgi:ion channel-forming bestrophin family protein